MKRKHHGVWVVGVALTAFAAIGVYALTGEWRIKDGVERLPPQTTLQIQVPDEQQVREMDRLYDRLHVLAAPHKRDVAAKKLSLFGYQDPAMTADGRRERDAGSLAENEFQLSLVVLDDSGSFCIVDGAFLAEGDRMDDGTQILKIESHRVLVARNREQKWIYLDHEPDHEPSSSVTATPKGTTGLQRGPS
jgi:hypothetical protein